MLPPTLISQVIHVPEHYPRIQQAIDSASTGDTILVDRGIYYETINFKGKHITVASRYILDRDETHIDSTIIDGTMNISTDTVYTVYFVTGEDSSSFLTGFSIRYKRVEIKNTEISVGEAFLISGAFPRLYKNKVMGIKYTKDSRNYPRTYVSWIYFMDTPYKVKGSLYEVGETTIAFIPYVTIKRGEITQVKPEILNVNQIDQIVIRRRGNLLKGGLIGAGLGVLLGVAIGFTAGDDPPCDNSLTCYQLTAGQKAFLAAVPCAGIGFGIGIALGSIKVKIKIGGDKNKFVERRGQLKGYSVR
jgi:hypothetical protein